jgi:hypothetical protein
MLLKRAPAPRRLRTLLRGGGYLALLHPPRRSASKILSLIAKYVSLSEVRRRRSSLIKRGGEKFDYQTLNVVSNRTRQRLRLASRRILLLRLADCRQLRIKAERMRMRMRIAGTKDVGTFFIRGSYELQLHDIDASCFTSAN